MGIRKYHTEEERQEACRRTRKTNKKKYRIIIKEWYINIMKMKFCPFCFESDTLSLDWHHLDSTTKINGVPKLVSKIKSCKFIMEEMEKCIIVCAHCHRKIHANRLIIGDEKNYNDIEISFMDKLLRHDYGIVSTY
jgi:hypothetical protein